VPVVNAVKSHSGWMASWCVSGNKEYPVRNHPVYCGPALLCVPHRSRASASSEQEDCHLQGLQPMGERPKRKGCKTCSVPQRHRSSPREQTAEGDECWLMRGLVERPRALEGRRVFTEGDVHARGSSVRRGVVQCHAAAFGTQKGRLQVLGRAGHQKNWWGKVLLQTQLTKPCLTPLSKWLNITVVSGGAVKSFFEVAQDSCHHPAGRALKASLAYKQAQIPILEATALILHLIFDHNCSLQKWLNCQLCHQFIRLFLLLLFSFHTHKNRRRKATAAKFRLFCLFLLWKLSGPAVFHFHSYKLCFYFPTWDH